MSNFTLPFLESYWVIPDALLAGEYPGRLEENETRNRIQMLIRSGIRVCIDLTKPGEIQPSYREVFLEELNQYGYKGNYYHFPIYDFGIPEVAQMKRTLDIIDDCISQTLPVYLHCHAGVGRTGLTVCCYLVRHGLKGDEAFERLKNLRKDVPSRWVASPETDAQVEFVRKWQTGS